MQEWKCTSCNRTLGDYEGRGAVIRHKCKRCGTMNVLDLRCSAKALRS